MLHRYLVTQEFFYAFQLDKSVLNDYVTLNETELESYNKSLVKHDCKVKKDVPYAETNNETGQCMLYFERREVVETCKCYHVMYFKPLNTPYIWCLMM